MRLGISFILWTTIVLIGATFVNKVVHVLNVNNTDAHTTTLHKHTDFNISAFDIELENLLWFIQVSDLHLSIFYDKRRISELREFCKYTVPSISPSAVLASGDLTDAKKIDMLGSKQYVEEWMIYRDILENSGVLNITKWLDIRGNHDNFDVPDLRSSNNFYQKYSVQGRNHSRSYLSTVRKGRTSVSFIAVDACLLPGPRRPFNFIGVLNPDEIDALKEFERQSHGSDYTVWFGHYPTSCIISSEPGIRHLMKQGLVYLCGHLHTLGGLVTNMYTRQQTGVLELELADWKDARMFRIAAIDNGLFSFIDIRHGSWPVILITNPKHALFMMPLLEPLELMKHTSHVRVLVWSLAPLEETIFRLDGSGPWHQLMHVKGPLFVGQWNPAAFSSGTHMIEVFVRDAEGRHASISQPFALGENDLSFPFWPRVILMSNVSMVFQFLFGVMVCLCVVPLCILRYMHYLVIGRKLCRPRFKMRFFRGLVRKFWILSSVNILFWPIILSTVYLPIGPWFIGEVLEGYIGIVFAWGTFVNHSFLPGSLTYAYGFAQMLFYHFPLLVTLGLCVDIRFQYLFVEQKYSVFSNIILHLSILLIIAIQLMAAYFFWLAYGTMALLLGPLRTWSSVMGIVLWYTASTLPTSKLRAAAFVWQPSYDARKVPVEDPALTVPLATEGSSDWKDVKATRL